MPFDTTKKKTFAAVKSAGQQASAVSRDFEVRFIPLLVKHMTLAIYAEKFGGVDGASDLNTQGADRTSKAPERASNFATAFAIARGQLVKYRMLTPNSLNGPVGNIKLTGSGRQREMVHKKEAGSNTKTKKFDALYVKFISPKPEKLLGDTK